MSTSTPAKHGAIAVDWFSKGYNCAQATAAAFAKDFDLEEAFVLRAMAGFGGGMGGLRGTCGAVSAMVFLAGLSDGHYSPDDHAAKKSMYDRVKQMAAEFGARHGSTVCAELLANAQCRISPEPSARTAEYYAKRPCARFVESAAEIAALNLLER
jgi:C_GCAxxG_C_C family probable redox protein